MKKIYSFAIAAATVCFMASCGGNKSGNAAEGQEAEAAQTEVEGAEQPLADELLKEPKTFEAAAFTMTAPAGWLVEGNDEESVDLCVPCETGDCKDVNVSSSSMSVDEAIETNSYDSFVEQEALKINDVDVRVVKKEENHMTIYRWVLSDGGNLAAYCQNCDINDADVKAILESIVLK